MTLYVKLRRIMSYKERLNWDAEYLEMAID